MNSVDDSAPFVGIQQPEEVVRAFLLTYVQDRLGRPASVTSRSLAHDALDALVARKAVA